MRLLSNIALSLLLPVITETRLGKYKLLVPLVTWLLPSAHHLAPTQKSHELLEGLSLIR